MKRNDIRSSGLLHIFLWLVPTILVLSLLGFLQFLYGDDADLVIFSPVRAISVSIFTFIIVLQLVRFKSEIVLENPNDKQPQALAVHTQLDLMDYVFSYVLLGHYITGVFILVFLLLPFTSIPVLFALLFFLLVHLFFVTWHLAKKLRRKEDLHSPIRYTFSEAGIEASYSTHVSYVPWSGVVLIKETESYLFLVLPRVTAIIPKRFFHSANEVEQVRQLVQRSQVRLDRNYFFLS